MQRERTTIKIPDLIGTAILLIVLMSKMYLGKHNIYEVVALYEKKHFQV